MKKEHVLSAHKRVRLSPSLNKELLKLKINASAVARKAWRQAVRNKRK